MAAKELELTYCYD